MRNFKAQLDRDIKDTFLNLNEFADIERIRYWNEGEGRPPVELHIPVVIEEEGDNTKTWNVQESYQLKNEPIITQKGITMYAALEDFGQIPKRHRRIQIGKSKPMEISSVHREAGVLVIKMRYLEE